MTKRKRDEGSSQPINRRSLIKFAAATGLAAAIPNTAAAELRLARLATNRQTARHRRGSKMTTAKLRAVANYRQSLAAYGGAMSSPIDALRRRQRPGAPYELDVAVIGSGYGGSICAARLAQRMKPGLRLAVMERGREWVPGMLPDTLQSVLGELRSGLATHPGEAASNPTGLIDYLSGKDVSVVAGSALGGTSIINANVVIKPERDIFRQLHWPLALRHREILDPFYDIFAMELGITPGEAFDPSPRKIAQHRAAARMAVGPDNFREVALSVCLDSRYLDASERNRQRMIMAACQHCGDCITGCNVGAKNTLQMTYLPLAKLHRAEVYTQVETRRIEKLNGYYRLHMVHHRGGDQPPVPFTTTARVVVVAGGSIGSSAIMLRSQEHGLALSPMVGRNWSGNGDEIGLATGLTSDVRTAGVGAYHSGGGGPAIQTATSVNQDLRRRVLVEDVGIPRALANLIGTATLDASLENVIVMLGMGRDSAQGRVVLDNDVPRVVWPGAHKQRYVQEIRRQFARMAAANGGSYRPFRILGDKMLTAHPLGGCNMADDPQYGVVSDLGEVYDGTRQSTAGISGSPMVHTGLYVADGSVIPGSLIANPFYTIGAVSERIAAGILWNPGHRDLFV